MSSRLSLVLLCVLMSCRILPPVPGAPNDEVIFSFLDNKIWSSKDLPVAFDEAGARSIFPSEIFPKKVWDVETRSQYNRYKSNKTSGLRRFFKFYVAETDPVSGLSIFVHEAIHAANYIDVLDMPYNEFLSITAELHLVTRVVKSDPDLAVQLLSKALVIYAPRDVHYEDQSHMRARLWLSALVETQEPYAIYKWARDCSKSEFYKKVDEAVGKRPRDVVGDGLSAFAKRHFPGDYVHKLIELRNNFDPRYRKEQFTALSKTLDKSHVYYDNTQWQIIKYAFDLQEHQDVLKRAELIWPKTRESLLAPAIANIAFESACIDGKADERDRWSARATEKPLWIDDDIRWKINRNVALYKNKHIDLLELIKNFEIIRNHSQWDELIELKDFLNNLEGKVLFEEMNRLNLLFLDNRENSEDLENLSELISCLENRNRSQFEEIVKNLREILNGYFADQAFRAGTFFLAKGLYENTSQGRHRLETNFWYEKHQ